jgi:hypothetical protein
MNNPIFLKGEHIIDGLAGMSHEETKRLLSLKTELFNSDGTPKDVITKEQNSKAQELIVLMRKRNILWSAMLN